MKDDDYENKYLSEKSAPISETYKEETFTYNEIFEKIGGFGRF